MTVALGMFYLTHDDPKRAIIAGVNWGPDTDCQGAMADGLAGSLNGRGSIPLQWINIVNQATLTSAVTYDHRTIEETATGL